LENTLVEAVVQARGKVILLEDIERVLETKRGMKEKEPAEDPSSHDLVSMEKDHIEKILTEVNWNRTETAKRLGISLPTLRSKIRKYDITPPDDSDN
jgi:two-component system response regulator AtoC